MNAEVTAENRPACYPNQHMFIRIPRRTYEDESRIQVLLMFLEEVLVVPSRHLAIIIVESSLVVLLSRERALCWAAQSY